MAFGAISRHWIVWKAAWQAESSRPLGKARFGARATEFLPSVLEIQQAPPSPIGRALLWTIVAAFTAGALWTTLGRIDGVATARGTIIPSGDSKIIQPYEAGVIASIHVQEGQAVKKGDVLIELDSTRNVADRARAVNEYRAANVEAARLRALIQGQATFEAPTDADEAYVLSQQQLLRDQLAEYHADVSAARHLVDRRRAAVGQDRAALAEAENDYRAMLSEFQQTKQAELSALEAKAASLAQEVTQAGQKAGLQRLVAPINGVVQQLAVHTVGGVVTPAQRLLIVVPKDHPVEVEAQIENKDRGFIRQGQPVEIQVETVQFIRYGTIPGHVVTVSNDAASIGKVGPVYPARVSLDRGSIQVEGKPARLSPGMAVTVEIKTGQRRIIEYGLGLLPKSMKESLRAR
ncbi:MAG: HlyD family efflux transporter periplasmic adaptor subunit [Nitrospira sp.]|nr:HlyD family efflux transporter periplasmic adaptor subunit [Nitrospira sp.]